MNHRVIFVPDDYWTNPPQENTNMIDHPRKAPPDVVPAAPPTRHQILSWNTASEQMVLVTEPGQMITDPDGYPCGVSESRSYFEPIGRLVVYRDQLDAVGLTDDDVPNLTIIERKGN